MLQVNASQNPNSCLPATLFAVPFGSGFSSGFEGLQVPVPLDVLAGGDLHTECWHVSKNKTDGLAEELQPSSWPTDLPHMPLARWQQARRGNFLLVTAELDEKDMPQPLTASQRARITQTVYQQGISHAAACGFDTLLRSWNYLPGITTRYGELDGYQLFCRGRELARNALQATGLFRQEKHPAATAIGTRNGQWQFVFLLVRGDQFHALENPRQIPAWQYPEIYSPSKPAFARAALVGSTLLCSGTASVLGHATTHENNAVLQFQESLRNIQALLRQAKGTSVPLSEVSATYRVYVRESSDAPAVEAVLKEQGIRHFVLLHGDICRADLLVECEAAIDLRQKNGSA